MVISPRMPKSFHPLTLTGLWFLAANLFSAAIPLSFWAADMVGGLLVLVIGVPSGVMSFLALNYYSGRHVWKHRPSIPSSILTLIAPICALLLSLWFLPALAELSWQAIHGARNVPIRPAFPIVPHSR